MAIEIEISTGSSLPIYRQIIDQIRRAVTSGQLVVGDQLPSVRSLANRLVVNHNTVAKAFSELSRDGVIKSQHGRGVFVAKRKNIYTKAERTRRLQGALDVFVSESLLLDFTHTEIKIALEKKLKAIEPADQKGA